MNARRWASGAVLLCALGCSSSTNGSGNGAGGTGGGGAGGGASASVGAFLLQIIPATPPSAGDPDGTAAHTELVGSVSDGARPDMVLWEEIDRTTTCRLLRPRVPFCSSSCTTGTTCLEGKGCIPDPKTEDVGTVHVTGLLPGEFDLEFIAGTYGTPAGTTLPFPPAPEGSETTLVGTGGPHGEFALRAKVVAPLVASGTVALERNQAVSVMWTPPAIADVSTVEVKLDISHHGGTKGLILCSVPDTGSLSIDARLATGLIDLGVAMCPSIAIHRIARGTALLPHGTVTYEVSSTIDLPVQTSITSCP